MEVILSQQLVSHKSFFIYFIDDVDEAIINTFEHYAQ